MKILILRHAETYENAEHVVQGQKDTLLNENGIEQAHKISRILNSKYKIDVIYSSPLQRALKTAEIISDGKIKVEVNNGLIERFMGKIEGLKRADAVAQRNKDGFKSLLDYGEDVKEVSERSAQAYRQIVFGKREEVVCIITHGSVLSHMIPTLVSRRWVRFLNQEVFQDYKKRRKHGNCSVTIIENRKMIQFNKNWVDTIDREDDMV